ncbi:hypothetical protein GGS26DRAFT_126278 [Hypomontagnella submonticulosa]|nr:hypothetical protein GGS26DRAFT_126278 [Hypomontagnella submonticulosa]
MSFNQGSVFSSGKQSSPNVEPPVSSSPISRLSGSPDGNEGAETPATSPVKDPEKQTEKPGVEPEPATTAEAATEDPLVVKRPIATPNSYELRMGQGWTVNDGTFAHVPMNKRRKRDVPYPALMGMTVRAMSGLSNLQLSHKSQVSPTALDVTMNHLRRCLPGVIRNQVNVIPPCGPDLWSEDAEKRKAVYKKMNEPEYLNDAQTGYYGYSHIRRRPWGFWPLWVEDSCGKNFVLAVWKLDRTDKTKEDYNILRSFNIYDPLRNPTSIDGWHYPFVPRGERLGKILAEYFQHGGIEVPQITQYWKWMAPMGLDEYSSAERVFAGAKEIMNSFVPMYQSGAFTDPEKHNWEYPNLTRWVRPYQYRIEMTGICAWTVMASFDYNARIVVERMDPDKETEVVVNGRKREIKNYELAGPYYEQPFTWHDGDDAKFYPLKEVPAEATPETGYQV